MMRRTGKEKPPGESDSVKVSGAAGGGACEPRSAVPEFSCPEDSVRK